MFTAEEARALSDKSNTFQERFKYTISAIKSAAKIGDYSVGLNDLAPDVREKLTELGYTLLSFPEWGDVDYYQISWEKEEDEINLG